jgi:recombination endonuclease VII
VTAVVKTCSGCKRSFSLEAFGSQKYRCRGCHSGYQRRWRERNQTKVRANDRAYRERNRTSVLRRQRNHTLRRKYGLSVDEFERMAEEQGGLCAACGREPSAVGLQVDHCHETGAVRALLCKSCNSAAGHANDDPAQLRLIADYLERVEVTR